MSPGLPAPRGRRRRRAESAGAGGHGAGQGGLAMAMVEGSSRMEAKWGKWMKMDENVVELSIDETPDDQWIQWGYHGCRRLS